MSIELINGDCLREMYNIPDNSIDMVCCDMPYGTTACKWDSVLPLDMLWYHYKRICKDNAAIVLNASQPFTSTLINSNLKWFKYCWVWEKSNPANIALASKQPLKYHEDICVFYKKQPVFNKQMIKRSISGVKRLKNKNNPIRFSGSDIQNQKGVKKQYDINRYNENYKNPSTVLTIKVERGKMHPTQKPVALVEYLIKTYTNEGETVLDHCMGSGTTGVAAKNLNRNFIGIEIGKEYFEIAKERINTEDMTERNEDI